MSSAAAAVTVLMCLVFLGASLMKLTKQPVSLASHLRVNDSLTNAAPAVLALVLSLAALALQITSI